MFGIEIIRIASGAGIAILQDRPSGFRVLAAHPANGASLSELEARSARCWIAPTVLRLAREARRSRRVEQ